MVKGEVHFRVIKALDGVIRGENPAIWKRVQEGVDEIDVVVVVVGQQYSGNILIRRHL
jgi:hypothetical protein